MSAPLLSAALIVRDEERAVARTIASLAGVVDRVTVLDTGSTDRTREAAREALGGGRFRSWQVVDGVFEDYAQARNLALDADAAGEGVARWVLWMSADEVLAGGDRLRAHLEAYEGTEEAHLLEVRTPSGAMPVPRVLRVGGSWRFEGIIHEEPKHQRDRERHPAPVVAGCWVEYAPTDVPRLVRRFRERDVPLLERRLASEAGAEQRARLALHLASAYEQVALGDQGIDRARHLFAALGLYAHVANSDQAPVEAVVHGRFKYLNVAEMIGIYAPTEMVARLRALADAAPDHAAVAYMLAANTAAVDAREGLRLAYRASSVAKKQVADPAHPHDPHGLLWRGHLLAANCAKALGHRPAAKKSAAEGLAAGGPKDDFEEFMR